MDSLLKGFRKRFSIHALLEEGGLLLVIVIFGVLLTVLNDTFLTFANLRNVVLQSTILAVIAVATTFVILTAGIDLSVGGVPALTSVAAIAAVLDFGAAPWQGVIVALLVGGAVGFINGLAVTRIGITPLIATLATLSATVGAAFAYTDGSNLTPVPDIYRILRTGEIFGVNLLIVLAGVIAVVAHLVLTRTVFGRSVYAVGGNPEAATLSGIPTNRVVMSTYIISALGASTAGLMITARLASGSPRAGFGVELTVIAAVVIGGTSLFGGRGNIRGTLLGVLLISMVTNAINLLGIPSAWDRLLLGGVIFLAAAIDVYRSRYTDRVMRRQATEDIHAAPKEEDRSQAGRDERRAR